VDEVVAGVEGMIDRFGEGWAVGAMQALIPELRAHGFPDASRALAERCIERINELVVTLSPEEVREKGYVPYHLGACSRWAGRPAQARTLYEEALAADDFPPWDRRSRYAARLSILAAERGDRAEADRYLQEYLQEITGSPRPEGAPADGQEPPGLLTQAKIAALLGEREQALAFLGRHVAGRTAMREQLHRMIEFESLWDDPEFEELIRPRD
jgi:tetratricopeptide (TPR) repeat protein